MYLQIYVSRFCVLVGIDRSNGYMSRAQLSAVPTPSYHNYFAFRPEFQHALLWAVLIIFHCSYFMIDPIRKQPITSATLVRAVGRYRNVMRLRTFGIYNALPLDHAVLPVSRIFVLQVCSNADLTSLRTRNNKQHNKNKRQLCIYMCISIYMS